MPQGDTPLKTLLRSGYTEIKSPKPPGVVNRWQRQAAVRIGLMKHYPGRT